MAIFPVLKFESTVQIGDQTRLDASKSFTNEGESITQTEIDPGSGTYIDVTSLKYLDTAYAAAGDQTIRVRINGTDEKSYTAAAVDEVYLSDDSTLEVHEPEIVRYVRDGRNSYQDVHRRIRDMCLDWLDSNRYWDKNGDRYTADDLIDKQDFKEWATLWALQLIFEGLSDKVDDKWMQKAQVYKSMALDARERGTYRLDYNQNGEIDDAEREDNWSKRITRV